MRVLGIIPAKGTSRGVYRKNLAPLCGKPLFAYSVHAALESKLTDVLVSTECDTVATVARHLRVRVVFEPPHFAAAGGDTLGVVRWNLNQLDVQPDAVMILQPTCPMRRAADIDAAIDLMERTGCDSVVSCVNVGANHPARMYRRGPDGRLVPLESGPERTARRQDLSEVLERSGDIYLTKREVLESGDLYGDYSMPLMIPPERHCNIDTRMDLLLAELLMKEVAT